MEIASKVKKISQSVPTAPTATYDLTRLDNPNWKFQLPKKLGEITQEQCDTQIQILEDTLQGNGHYRNFTEIS